VDEGSAGRTDGTGLEVLGPVQCASLLEATPIGRLAFVVDGEPVVIPVNYAFVDGAVVFRTLDGQKLQAAIAHQVVAFEVDEWDASTRKGWSVLVKGRAEEVTQWAEAETLELVDLVPWAHQVWRDRWVRVTPHQITGRRVL